MTKPFPKMDLVMSTANLGKDNNHRMQLLQTVLSLVPNFVNINLVEHVFDGRKSTCKEVIHRLAYPENINLIQLKGREYYNHQHAFNLGALEAKTNILLFANTDLIARPDFFEQLYCFLDKETLKWAIAWGTLLYKNEQGLIYRRIKPQPMNAEGGINYFNKQFFFEIGGWNDFMGELAGGDNEIIRRAEYKTNTYNVLNETFTHLWHPTSSVKQKRSKFYKQNKEILDFSWQPPLPKIYMPNFVSNFLSNVS